MPKHGLTVQFPHKYLRSTAAKPMPPVDLSNFDNRKLPAAVVFSSGTSGKPKGVHLSHYGMIANALSNRAGSPEIANANEREVFFGPCTSCATAAILPTDTM
jgi:long-subunit acyl-CoA synthetase (AMP-forming)